MSHLEWPFFDERHRLLDQRMAAWIPSGLGSIDDTADERRTCARLVKALAAGGFLAPSDVRSLCLLRERLAHHHGLADFAFAIQGLGSAPIDVFGSEALKERYLPGTRNGERIAAFALSEPDAGSDVGAISTRAERSADEYVLNGVKTWISNGGLADYYVVFARSEETRGTKGLSAFVVEANDPGFHIAEEIEVVAPHPLATLAFENCRLPAHRLVGQPGQGFEIAMATLDIFRSTVGAAALGFARRALDEAMARVESRVQFGQKLADFQLVQAKLADMTTAIDASALLVYRAAWLKDRGAGRVTKESSMAKMYATEAAQRVVDDAVQLFGAAGVVRGSVVERLYREVRALRIYEGTTEIHKLILARQTRAEYSRR
ncbi:MAG TPA: acyl-CoA dehydrogenase family protein [Vicinamibacteria bacterium]|nr:acyl-CoA dehydrogenase family protein [Vicinamibacteria bacterium]